MMRNIALQVQGGTQCNNICFSAVDTSLTE